MILKDPNNAVVASNFTSAHPETYSDLCAITEAAIRTEPDYATACERLSYARTVRLLHAAIGLCTESAEFLGMLKKHIYYGAPIDMVNAVEEIGDSSWYQRIALDEMSVDYVEMLLLNVRKLKARYGHKFTEFAAMNRDVEAERKILEDAPYIHTALGTELERDEVKARKSKG